MVYWVIGGEYTGTDFKRLAPGSAEERLGPFASLKDAREAWSAKAFATVDNAHARYRIFEDKDGKLRETRSPRPRRRG
jgi:hypothetical protein